MSRLPLEPYLHPPDLLDGDRGTETCTGAWTVLHTKPRSEKAIARRLLRDCVGFFLPLARQALRNNRTAQPAYLPLFPGYLFLFGDVGARLSALRTNQVVRWLPVPDQEQLHNDLRGVHQLMTSASGLVRQARFVKGTPVEI